MGLLLATISYQLDDNVGRIWNFIEWTTKNVKFKSKQVRRHEIGDVVILDADANTVETPFDDLNNLPQEVVASLKKQLRNKSLGDGVSRAFLRALVQLIGGYRDALRFQPGQKVTFDEEKFIETRPLSLQPFLREMLQLQIFQQEITQWRFSGDYYGAFGRYLFLLAEFEVPPRASYFEQFSYTRRTAIEVPILSLAK
ncbi:hypothetical protein NQ317_014282 [Molorchus minor]|uniref:UDENN domain-containing protein n=1 Tax=Molorchus minor TaxID=1323400 RepID=A0ABQ9IUA0_9CUCU|nr:hypothetical protein NQ317_014282 [Molorchus minor]